MRLGIVLGFFVGIAIAVGLMALTVEGTPTDTLHNCPQSGKWAISVWGGDNSVGIEQALATCNEARVIAAYGLDADTQGWSRWLANGPEINTLETIEHMEGIITLGGESLTTITPRPDESGTPNPPLSATPTPTIDNTPTLTPTPTVEATPTLTPTPTPSPMPIEQSFSGHGWKYIYPSLEEGFALFVTNFSPDPEATAEIWGKDCPHCWWGLLTEGAIIHEVPWAGVFVIWVQDDGDWTITIEQ